MGDGRSEMGRGQKRKSKIGNSCIYKMIARPEVRPYPAGMQCRGGIQRRCMGPVLFVFCPKILVWVGGGTWLA